MGHMFCSFCVELEDGDDRSSSGGSSNESEQIDPAQLNQIVNETVHGEAKPSHKLLYMHTHTLVRPMVRYAESACKIWL